MKRKDTDHSRRSFLRDSLVTGVAAGAAATPLKGMAALAPEADAPAEAEKGYRVTDHVKAYYRSLTR